MGAYVVEALSGFTESIGSVASSALTVAAGGLLIWVGWRLACKLLNRGVGK